MESLETSISINTWIELVCMNNTGYFTLIHSCTFILLPGFFYLNAIIIVMVHKWKCLYHLKLSQTVQYYGKSCISLQLGN